jgi:hypothetical protein
VPAPIFIASPGTAAAGAENVRATASTTETSQRNFLTLLVTIVILFAEYVCLIEGFSGAHGP